MARDGRGWHGDTPGHKEAALKAGARSAMNTPMRKEGNMSLKDNTFAAACYNDNSIKELLNALLQSADKTDCSNWKITPTQWRESIIEALKEKISNYVDINSLGHGKDEGKGGIKCISM